MEALNTSRNRATTAVTTESASTSVRVREESCKIKPKATLFRPKSTPGPRYTSNTLSSLNRPDALTVTFSCKTARGTLSSTTMAKSRRTLGNFEIPLNFNDFESNAESISSSNKNALLDKLMDLTICG